MAKVKGFLYGVCFVSSVALNFFFVTNSLFAGYENKQLSWSQRAAAEAEAVASVSCSGHGRAYLDGLIVEGKPVCECNTCYEGPDCSQFLPDCAANAESGDPLFLEPFWMQHAESSAVIVAGWHRMSYVFADHTSISQVLQNHIHKVHSIARNAITKGKYIVFGVGSTQLLSAAVFALSLKSSSLARVFASSPYYPVYKTQTDFFETVHFEFQGDASVMKNTSDSGGNVIEFVTSPNNPDGHLRKAILPSANAIYDRAYYWPHFTAIPAPADEDIMIFTISKLTGRAGSRFGWALVKDKDVYLNMCEYLELAEMGVSRDTQLRALQLLKVVLEGDGSEIFHFAYEKMRDRWEKISQTVSFSKRFTIQEIPPQYCNFFEKIRGPSPAYVWLKCEREEDTNCNDVLGAANIIGRSGRLFNSEDRYVRLSLLKSDDDFNLLLYRLKELVTKENGTETMCC
ncbi:tryptophan aminotransferase-related 4-like [Olea europaea subsp. europaea]|uniref:Tryptophan aminotransferase-related 4-like n=1 Tax=Olea europaea subsp. europaea TaxID=158383 RepID=A0A8S0PDI9_OLEEU|nr:tryptophan aminotransferase-related 4-like [Olea europaea subsp. europaea]